MTNPSGTATAGGGDVFNPRDAAALLEQTQRKARRQFEPTQPWLLVIRAVLVLAALGTVWLSVRGQQPYAGPGSSALLVIPAFVLINFTAVMTVRRRATAGVSGGTRFSPVEIAILTVAWVAPFLVMAALGDTGNNDSGYLLTVPLIVVGLSYAAIMATRAGWRECATGLAIAATGAVGASAGQADAWAVTGVGLCLTLLGNAAVITWQFHRV